MAPKATDQLALVERTDLAPDVASKAREKPSYYSKDAVKIRQRVADLLRFGRIHWGRGPLPRTAETKRFEAVVLHHFQHYAEGNVLAQNFLSTWTDLDVAARAATIRLEFKDARFYDAEKLAELIGLTMRPSFRKR